MHLASMNHAAMEWAKSIVLLKIAICLLYYSADAQTLSVSGGLMNNGPVAINFQPLYTASFSSLDFVSCSWRRNSESEKLFFNFNCASAASLVTNNATCSKNGNTVTGTYLPPAVTANVTVSLICNPAFPQPNFVLSAQPCGNPGRYRVTPNVPANTGYGDSHNFTCLENSPNKFQVAVCQADASWNLTLDCTPGCNNSNLPQRPEYEVPQSGMTNYNETFSLMCSGNYNGTVTALCLGNDTWQTPVINCNGICNVSSIQSDISYENNQPQTLQVSQGQSVSLFCKTGYTGAGSASCTGPAQWTVTPCSAVCSLPVSGTNSQTYCSNNDMLLNITEGTPGSVNVYCCDNAAKRGDANCLHNRTISSNLDCTVATTTTFVDTTSFVETTTIDDTGTTTEPVVTTVTTTTRPTSVDTSTAAVLTSTITNTGSSQVVDTSPVVTNTSPVVTSMGETTHPAATTADMSTASMRNTVSSAAISTNNNLVTTTPAATTTSAGATAFGSFWNGSPLVMLFVSVVCNHI